jgi:3-mercaptopyruvate sulfurtransferase SseA
MVTFIANLILAAAVQDHSWDCPGTGFLPFRRELLVTTGQLAEWIESSEATLLHVGFDESAGAARRRARYSDGHLPGALHLKWSILRTPLLPAASRVEALEALGLTPGRRLVLYDTGLGFEAAAAYVALDSLGLADRAALLDGQWAKWVAEGRPLCRWTTEATPSRLDVRSTEIALRSRATALMVLQPDVLLLDARPGPILSRRPHVAMSGPEQLSSLQMPLWKAEKDLRCLWSAVPARAEQRLVVAGRHWTQAAPVYFAAKLLGYLVQVLDGSIEELGNSEEALESGP